MAQTFLVTNIQIGNREDLADFIQQIAYEETPFFSKCGRTQAKAILHEWMTESTRAGAANARAEGYTPTFDAADQTPRVRRTNPVQLLAVPFSVSGTQDAVDKAGIGVSSEYDHQKDLKFKELAKDNDWSLLQETRATRDADAGTAGEMDGALLWPAGTLNSVQTGSPLLTEDLYNSLAQVIYETSGKKATDVFCGGYQKRAITGWSTPIRRMADEKTKTNSVMQYDGDWGSQSINHDINMPAAQLLIIEMSIAKVAFLRPVEHYELGRTRDIRSGYVLSELTLEIKNPNAIARFTGLATSS